MCGRDGAPGAVQRAWERGAGHAVHAVERSFYLLGVRVASRPGCTIALALAFVALSAAGLLRFHHEKDPMKLWVPPDSDFYRDTEWLIQNFGNGFRLQQVLLTADEALDPRVVYAAGEISEGVQAITVQNYTMRDLCFKVPVVSYPVSSRSSRSVASDNSEASSVDLYCEIIHNLKQECFQTNIVDLWHYNLKVLKNVTKKEILNKINSTTNSPTIGHPIDYTATLGQVNRDETGNIVSAKSILLTWYMHVDFTTVDIGEVGNLVGTQDWVSLTTLAWEQEFLDFIKSYSQNVTGIKIYYHAGRSFGDISGATMFQDMDKLFIGIALMFLYIQVVMSEFNWLEVRLTLGSLGLLCVGMAYIAACGWCSVLGIPYGPVHASLPFLLMGLGIDDMFVMKACWEQLTQEEKEKSLPVQVGLMLKHAGVSIVITSFTDVVAFLIGSITILPSLRSFCFYAAFGVFFIFCFSVTFYVAVFTLDINRIQANRNGFLFCYIHKKPIQLKKSLSYFQRSFAALYEKFVFTTPIRVIVIAFTLVMTAVSIEAVFRLEQRFDPDWFIPDGTYFKDFLDHHKYYYPEEGQPGVVFLGAMQYHEEFANLYEMVKTLKNESYINELTSWVESLHDYVQINFDKDLVNSVPSSDEFGTYLSEFLFSLTGGRFQQNFKFSSDLICGKPVPNITASSIRFRFTRFEGPTEYLPAMNSMKDIVRSTNITSGDGYRSVWSKIFANWAVDEIIGVEVERNVELALICVMACTVILITNIQMCVWIFLCVLLTLINVCGWMQRWGLTVDIVSCIGLELAIGLCVDYAAHVGHTFLTISEGTRTSRSLRTVTSIGAAVMYGGGSTLLSLSVLSMSKAYTFNSFFKIFLLVIIFGLFHGLVFLPVMLSLIGPRAYHHNAEEDKSKAIAIEVEELCKVPEHNGS